MNPDEKRKLVERLVALTMPELVCDAKSVAEETVEFASRLREKLLQKQIELHIKHLEPEQIQALLDFYDTDMGASILKSQAKIEEELANTVSVVDEASHG